MSLTKNRYTYVDFRDEEGVPLFAKTTNAIATAVDTQEDYMRVNGQYFEHIQTGANAALQYVTSSAGWKLPLDNTDGDGIEITQGMLASRTPMKFTAGTDAFFIRVKAVVTTLANIDCFWVGFRELGSYVAITTPATMASVYDEKAIICVNTNAGAVKSITSIGGSDVTTTATNTPIVTATEFDWAVYVAKSGAVTYKISGAADALLAAATQVTFTANDVFVPTVGCVATGAGAPNVVLVSYECGLQ
jgi:hypothetical protein